MRWMLRIEWGEERSSRKNMERGRRYEQSEESLAFKIPFTTHTTAKCHLFPPTTAAHDEIREDKATHKSVFRI